MYFRDLPSHIKMGLLYLQKIYHMPFTTNYLSSVAGLLLLVGSCSPSAALEGEFDKEMLRRYCHENSGIILSCIHCGCIRTFASDYLKGKETIALYGDTLCFPNKSSNFFVLKQAVLDSVYERNYNAILYKNLHQGDLFQVRILKNGESKEFQKIVKRFF